MVKIEKAAKEAKKEIKRSIMARKCRIPRKTVHLQHSRSSTAGSMSTVEMRKRDRSLLKTRRMNIFITATACRCGKENRIPLWH